MGYTATNLDDDDGDRLWRVTLGGFMRTSALRPADGKRPLEDPQPRRDQQSAIRGSDEDRVVRVSSASGRRSAHRFGVSIGSRTDLMCPDSGEQPFGYRVPWPRSVNPQASIGDRSKTVSGGVTSNIARTTSSSAHRRRVAPPGCRASCRRCCGRRVTHQAIAATGARGSMPGSRRSGRYSLGSMLNSIVDSSRRTRPLTVCRSSKSAGTSSSIATDATL